MRRLVYHSIAEFRNKSEENDAIQNILKVSHINNQTLGITGVLMYEDLIFTQVLEGPAEAVSEITLRISQDPRHHTMVIDQCHAIDERLFEDFTMGYVTSSHHELRQRLKAYLAHVESGRDPSDVGVALKPAPPAGGDPAAVARRRAGLLARQARHAFLGF